MDSSTPPPAPPTCCYYYFFRICMDYTLCVPHLCETQKYETKKMTKALQRTKNYVGEILITSFKLPVLSCSQLLKITGLKKTIYNVLALDRCSTCVTVLIYETKMVTVNYVFLCAFFFFVCFKVGDGFRNTAAAGARARVKKKRKKKFCFWWSIKKRFRKRRKKNGGKKSRKMWKI